jgi:hypothetical protein
MVIVHHWYASAWTKGVWNWSGTVFVKFYCVDDHCVTEDRRELRSQGRSEKEKAPRCRTPEQRSDESSTVAGAMRMSSVIDKRRRYTPYVQVALGKTLSLRVNRR